ncbi:hypothetical protein B0J14DRAFT_667473 [Halenospora varia]|nr:hypothetical protein B0J14DRAFT_667473 [Halenospora varia]
MAWERHKNNIYNKITHWFEVIREVLQDPAILPENVYNMDETGVMLCMLGSIQVLPCKREGVYEEKYHGRIGTLVTPKPPAQSTVPRANKIQVGACHQDEVPQTPVTPVLVGGLASLQNLIKQDAYMLNETGIPRLERHVQKLAHAARISFAERALLYDQNQMLTRMNNEAKVRRSTRSVVLGKAKVMSFEDIKVARAARAAKEAIKGQGKRGRKRKSAALEADKPEVAEPEAVEAAELELELEPEVARIIDALVL